MKKYQLVMFDLDGTIADTSEGVINCVKYTEKKLQLEHLDQDIYKKFIGPPNRESYNQYYGLVDEMLDSAVKTHKEYAIKYGIYEAKLYEGVRELLDVLKTSGIMLAVVTLKLKESTIKMLQYFNLANYFDVVVAATEKKSKKSDLIKLCLKKTDISKENALMIGDSEYDQIGALESMVDFVGVTYGFGFHTKMDTENMPCIAVAENIEELYQLFNER